MRFMWLTHSHTYVCFRLNKMAAMVIDKFHSLSSVLFSVIVRHFAYTLKEIDDALKDLNSGQSGSGGDTLSVWLASKELWVIVAAKLNDEKFSLAKLQAQLPTPQLSPSVTASVVHLIDEMINIWSCLPLSAASARKNCNKLLLQECWGHYYCVIIKAFLMLNVKCRTDKQPQLSMQEGGRRMPGWMDTLKWLPKEEEESLLNEHVMGSNR